MFHWTISRRYCNISSAQAPNCHAFTHSHMHKFAMQKQNCYALQHF